MKAKNNFFILIFLILGMAISNLFLKTAVSQPIPPQNNIPDSRNVNLIGRWTAGPCWAVVVDITGTIACLGNGSYLEIVSLSNPYNPTELGKILLPAPILGVTIKNSLAYVADAGAGLRIIDISNPANPVEIAYFETLGVASGLAIEGTKVYLADGDRGLLVIDISIPSQPKQMGICHTDGWAGRVVINGSFAYVADRQGGLKVIDISNPYDPQEIAKYITTGDVMDVAISGTSAYVAAGSAGFRVVDISNPFNPLEIGFSSRYQFANGIAVRGTYAYLTDGENGLRIIDIANPYQPGEAGSYDTNGNSSDVVVSGSYALVADGHNGLRVINVSNYFNPNEIGFFNTGGSSRGVAVDGNYAYLVKWEAGLRIINIADPSKPVKIGSLNLTGRAEDIALKGNNAYLTNYENGLRVIDISDRSQPQQIGSIIQNMNSKRIAIKGNYAYIADTTFGLRSVDISDPSQPILISSYEFPGKRADAIAIKENYAFLAAGNDGLGIVDIATPSQTTLTAVLNLGGTAISIDVDGNYAYLGTLQNDLNIVDISDPALPFRVGTLEMYSPLYEINAKARYVYVANGASGLRAIDVINSSKPIETGFYVTGSTAFGLTLNNNYIYLSCGETGLFILEFLPVSLNKPPLSPILTLPANKSFLNSATPQLICQVPVDENGDLLHFKIELDKDGIWSSPDYVFESKKNVNGFSPIPPLTPGSGLMNFTIQSPLPGNNWYWRVAAWDGLVYGEYSTIWSFTIDTTAPVLKTVTFESPGYENNWFNPNQDTSVTLIVTFDELYPQVGSLAGAILPDTIFIMDLPGGFNQEVKFDFSIANQHDGIFPLQASIRDSAGNIGSQAGAIQLDSTPPAGYFSDAPDTIASGLNYSVHVSGANDSPGCGVAKIYLDVFSSITGDPTTVQDSMVGMTKPGIYFYRYFAEDNLGNHGEIKTDTTVVTPVYPRSPIFPASPSTEIIAGDDFWIDIHVGTEQQPVENLFSVNFILNYSNTQYVDVVSQANIIAGDLFGNNVNLSSQIDDQAGKITIAISKKSGDNNADGYGTLTRIKYNSQSDTPDRPAIHFTIPSVTAADSAGYPIELMPRDTTIWIVQPVSDFIMTIFPEDQTIHQGDSADFIISLDSLGFFDSQISLKISNLPEGMEAKYPSEPFAIPGSFPVIFSTMTEIVPGTYQPVISATGGGITHSATVVINVLPKAVQPDFVMTVQPQDQTIQQGKSTEFSLAFQPIGEFDSQISLEISNLPEGIEAKYPSGPFAIPDSFQVIFSTMTEIVSGSYQPVITATGGGITHSATVVINVLPMSITADFTMTVVPDSQTIIQGENTKFTLSFQKIGEFNSQISLEISGLASGIAATYPSDPFTIPISSDIIFSTTVDIEPGVYNPIIIKATGGGITHQITIKITILQRADFVMIIEPDQQDVTAGDSIEFYISFTPVGGFNSPITVVVSNVPTGMGDSYPSQPFKIPFSTTVAFRTLRNIPTKVYHPTVTASGGGITHQETVAINVLPAPLIIQNFSVQPNPFTPNNDGYNDFAEFQYPEPSSGSASISIFDVNGRKIIEIRNSRYWYGKDDKGRDVKPGAYIYVVKDGDKVMAKGVLGLAR